MAETRGYPLFPQRYVPRETVLQSLALAKLKAVFGHVHSVTLHQNNVVTCRCAGQHYAIYHDGIITTDLGAD